MRWPCRCWIVWFAHCAGKLKARGTEYITLFSLVFYFAFFGSKHVTISGTTTINYHYCTNTWNSTVVPHAPVITAEFILRLWKQTTKDNSVRSADYKPLTINKFTMWWSTLYDEGSVKAEDVFLSSCRQAGGPWVTVGTEQAVSDGGVRCRFNSLRRSWCSQRGHHESAHSVLLYNIT